MATDSTVTHHVKQAEVNLVRAYKSALDGNERAATIHQLKALEKMLCAMSKHLGVKDLAIHTDVIAELSGVNRDVINQFWE